MGGASGGAAQAGRRGAFILFEGVDRCGKTTQSRRLVAHLRALGVRPRRPACAPAVNGRAMAGHGHCDIALTWTLGRVGERPVPGGRALAMHGRGARLQEQDQTSARKSRAGHQRADRVGKRGNQEDVGRSERVWVSWARPRQPQRRAQVYTTQPGVLRSQQRAGQGAVVNGTFAHLGLVSSPASGRRVLPAWDSKAREADKAHWPRAQVDAELWRFPDRTTAIGRMIDAYLTCKAEADDAAMHLLFSANRWEKRCQPASRSGRTAKLPGRAETLQSLFGLDAMRHCTAPGMTEVLHELTQHTPSRIDRGRAAFSC